MKFQNLSADGLKRLRAAIDAALADVASKHGLASLHAGNVSYDPHSGHFCYKLEGVVAGGIDRAGALYNSLRDSENMPPLGSMIDIAGGAHKIVGANSTGSKVLIEKEGKRYTIGTGAVRSHFAQQKIREAKAAGAASAPVTPNSPELRAALARMKAP